MPLSSARKVSIVTGVRGVACEDGPVTLTRDDRTVVPRQAVAPAAALAVVLVTISCVLVVDASGPLWMQRLLGVATWCVLLVLLSGESALVRSQTAIVVVFATAVEYTFSPVLEVYVYRFDNVPMYVPPGHGLVYFAALSVARMTVVQARERLLMTLVLGVGGSYAAYGVTAAERTDALGGFWYLCLVGFLLWGPSRGLYIGAFVMVTYLEVVGTTLGTWEWQRSDPTGIVAIGNPPSGAAGGYGWFDLAALVAGPAVLAAWRWWRRTPT